MRGGNRERGRQAARETENQADRHASSRRWRQGGRNPERPNRVRSAEGGRGRGVETWKVGERKRKQSRLGKQISGAGVRKQGQLGARDTSHLSCNLIFLKGSLAGPAPSVSPQLRGDSDPRSFPFGVFRN